MPRHYACCRLIVLVYHLSPLSSFLYTLTARTAPSSQYGAMLASVSLRCDQCAHGKANENNLRSGMLACRGARAMATNPRQ